MRALVICAALLAGCTDPPSARGAIEIDTCGEREERDVDVYLATQAEVATSAPVLERALERLGVGADAAAVRERVEVERRGESAILDVRVSIAGDPEEAVALCNAIIQAYIERRYDVARATAPSAERNALLDIGARALEVCHP